MKGKLIYKMEPGQLAINAGREGDLYFIYH